MLGRPGLAPGRYFRLLLLGYFEGIDSERGIAWRATDSLSVRGFLRLPVDEPPPDHTTLSRTRRLIDVETHRDVFTWVQHRLVEAGLLVGKTIGIDATTLEANAAMRSIVRRDTGDTYAAFLTGLAKTSGIRRWWISTPSDSAPTLRSRIGGAAIGRRRRRRVQLSVAQMSKGGVYAKVDVYDPEGRFIGEAKSYETSGVVNAPGTVQVSTSVGGIHTALVRSLFNSPKGAYRLRLNPSRP